MRDVLKKKIRAGGKSEIDTSLGKLEMQDLAGQKGSRVGAFKSPFQGNYVSPGSL